jgi:hypothetical protein
MRVNSNIKVATTQNIPSVAEIFYIFRQTLKFGRIAECTTHLNFNIHPVNIETYSCSLKFFDVSFKQVLPSVFQFTLYIGI